MQGAKQAGDWYFYHDALALITSRYTKEWMNIQTVEALNDSTK